MVKRLSWILVMIAAVGALVWRFPLAGQVWAPTQIKLATMDGYSVPSARYSQLFWDAQFSRIGDAPSKCAGFATIELTNGRVVQVRLSASRAAQHWPSFSC